jgi:hypothetical protein
VRVSGIQSLVPAAIGLRPHDAGRAPALPTQEVWLTRWPFHVASANQVEVHVKDGLAALRSDVKYRAISIFNATLATDFRGHQVEAPDGFGIVLLRLFQSPDVLLGNHQHVRGRLRVDVLEGEGMLVFVNLLARNLATNDFAEETVCHKKAAVGR